MATTSDVNDYVYNTFRDGTERAIQGMSSVKAHGPSVYCKAAVRKVSMKREKCIFGVYGFRKGLCKRLIDI